MSVGFHRYFTHRTFKANRFWRYVMLAGGTLAGQGSVVFWTALHRLHHPASDKPEDIHTPTKGFWHAYMGWIFTLDPTKVSLKRAVDLIRDPACRFTHTYYHHILWAWWSIVLLIGSLGSWDVAAGILLAGMWSIHQEALINSVCHDSRFGFAAWSTNDGSRDVRALHYLTWGQSFHNSHHAFPASPNFRLYGWRDSKDIGYRLIKLIQTKA